MNITMIKQSGHAEFNIMYHTILKEYFITSKTDADTRPQIGGFRVAADAIDFAIKRVS